ncbi:MAG: RluA family pseudouridine synthase [Bacteroidia bacterium]|nr:RluA family pseudouridine synthase [Bacteroidia bacterium]
MRNKPTSSNQKQFSLKVTEAKPLMEFLSLKLPDYSKTTLKSLLTHRQLFLNGEIMLVQHDYMLKPGDRIDIRSSKGERGHVLDHPSLKIIYEDDAILVVDKKEGLLSVRTEKDGFETASHLLNTYMRAYGRGSHIYVVHRLDRDTSGVMMFAKTKEVQEILRDNWNDLVQERTYIAVAEGVFEQAKGTIASYLTEDVQKKMHSSLKDNGGQYAVTHYEVVAANKKYSLLKLNLETGRKNQIRVHLQSIGHPVTGDTKYGGSNSPAKRLCLHAETLKFKHPVTKKLVAFEIPVPTSFLRLTGLK